MVDPVIAETKTEAIIDAVSTYKVYIEYARFSLGVMALFVVAIAYLHEGNGEESPAIRHRANLVAIGLLVTMIALGAVDAFASCCLFRGVRKELIRRENLA